MLVTLRLDVKTEKSIENTARNIGISKSELIRKSILEYLGKFSKETPWDLGKDLFARHAGGKHDLAGNASKYFKEKLKASDPS